MWDVRRLCAILVLVGSIGCDEAGYGGGPGGSPAPPPPPPSGGNTIAMTGGTFAPSTLSIELNETVTWSNTSGQLHNVTFSTPGAPANIPDHTSGNTDRTFNALGTFDYTCTNHGGMTGSVTVQ